MMVFNVVSLVVLYAMERLQHLLPLNPDKMAAVPAALAWNTAVSFTTNTNWQAYSGESTMSLFTQMAGLAVHNFASAATGIAIAIAFVRGSPGSRRRASATSGPTSCAPPSGSSCPSASPARSS